MYRVVLIDDERLIVEGLRKVVKWADYGCEVVGTAENASTGAELIRSLQPHILFTDIRMPGDSGLTMLAALRSEFPGMQVVVLTGYRDFSYAQEAIRLGVSPGVRPVFWGTLGSHQGCQVAFRTLRWNVGLLLRL